MAIGCHVKRVMAEKRQSGVFRRPRSLKMYDPLDSFFVAQRRRIRAGFKRKEHKQRGVDGPFIAPWDKLTEIVGFCGDESEVRIKR